MLRRTLRSRGPLFVLADRRDAATLGEPLRFTDIATATAFLVGFLSGTSDAAALRAAAAELSHGVPARDDQEAVAIVAAALVAERARVARRWAPADPSGRARARERREKDVLDAFEKVQQRIDNDWIEIKLVDEDGAAIAGERYKIVTPDGREFRGYTDSLGVARLTRIPSGECEVSFPDLDMKAWEPA